MVVNIRVLLFGDQSKDVSSDLRELVSVKDNPLLLSFFEKAYITLRDEVARDPRTARDLPGFTSVENLLWRYSESGVRHPAIESALVCIYQIASLLRYLGDGSEEYPSAENTRLVGSCTGLLTAAAVSCSRTYLDLVNMSVDILKIAFRVGAQVAEAGDELEQTSTNSASWSAIFPGIGKEAAFMALEDFRTTHGIPPASGLFVSATSSNAVTISGPPHILDELIKSGSIKSNRPVRLPIYGPYHAPHLYNNSSLASILESLSQDAESSWTPRIPIISNDGRDVYQVSSVEQLLKEVLQDILLKPLNWERICENCGLSLQAAGAEQGQVVPMGANNGANSMVNALKQHGEFQISLDDRRGTEPDKSDGVPPTGRLSQSKIAIVGMSGRFPDAASPSAFWDLLKQGLDVHREIPKDRFDAQAHVDPTGKQKNTSHTPFGCFIEDPGLFDARFFNMSPKEATQTDPMHRLALTTAYEALEMSGYVPNRTPSTMVDRIGTFYGQTSDDWREIQDGQNIQTYFIPGGVRAFAPGRINYHFKFSGPSFSVDTACSSSLAAINIACNSLWQGDCDTAVAGGLNVLTNPDIFAGLSRGQFLSKTGNCKTFDDQADGYCRGDGVGTVILKRLEDAEADKDPILAVILGTGTNHSAEAVSITHPHAGAQEYLFKKVLSEASLDPHDVSYVEMHGTGTQAGDGIEMKSVLGAFAPENRKRRPDQPLYLGSVKSNVGHGEAASGITALVKILLMLDNNLIPPHCGIKTKLNHTFPDLDARNVHISLGGSTPWHRPEGGKRSLFLNNFSAAGGNTSLIMEDAPLSITGSQEDTRSTAVVAVSGKCKSSLIGNVENLIQYLSKNPSTDLSNLSYTTTARRIHYAYRAAVAGSDLPAIKAALKRSISSEITPVSSSKPPVVFAFTGQGSHYSAMGKTFFDTISQFRSDVQRFDLLVQSQGFPSVLPLIDGSADIETLGPLTVQLGAVCVQMALVRLWETWGIKPAAVIGHSLGEYAALYAAGVLSISDTIFLAGTRAKLLETHCTKHTHAMLAVPASTSDLEGTIDGDSFEVACVNGPKATVISGKSTDVDRLREDLTSQGMKCTKLEVPFAFHSAQVEPALQEFEAAAAGVTFNNPDVPVISPLLSSVVTDNQTFNAPYLARHCRRTVNFLGGLHAAKGAGVIADNTVFVEVGSHPVCSGMIKATLGSSTTAVPSLRRGEDVWKVISGSLCALHTAGLDIKWNSYHQDFSGSSRTLRLPTYAWNSKNYWIYYTNNWTLTKGEFLRVSDAEEQQKKTLSTTSVHRVVEEEFKGQECTVVTETDIARPDLEETIKGHLVNGSALCSSAVYADMALTIADYIHRQIEPENEDFAMNCSSMVVDKPLVAKCGDTPQLLRTSSTADLSRELCEITFYSANAEGEKTVEHAKCKIQYGDATRWSSEWARQRYLVQPQVDRLLQGVEKGNLSRLRRKMAYKLFSALVDYQDVYKGMAEVVLDSPNREGTARVELPMGKSENFFVAPYHIDSLCHLAGFIMNANDELDSTKTVFVNHGWDSLRFAEKPLPHKTYYSYVRMQPASPDSKDYVGDVYVFDTDGKIIGQIGGLEFQFLPKQTLDRVLPPVGAAKTSAPVATAKAAPKPQKTVSKPPPRPKAAVTAASPSVMSRALDIMAEETGVPATELADDNELSALGIDSLLSLTISGKFREILEIEVPSTLFVDCQTIKEVKDFFAQHNSAGPGEIETSSSDSAEISGTTTPASQDSMTSLSEIGDEEPTKGGDDVTAIREAMSEETGVPHSDITSSTKLADIGIDSLMSLQISGSLREEHGLDLPPTFFGDHQTFADIEKARGGSAKPALPPQSETMSTEHIIAEVTAKELTESVMKKQSQTPSQEISRSNLGPNPPSATSVLLQGSTKTASQTLFLFPDGSGSATSYATIPPIAPDNVAVVGLNCPFMKTPTSFNCGIDGVVSLYLNEIRRRQPHGPYVLGGWSAGGICAYEACLQLQAVGETVEKLIFFDVPCPLPPQALPSRLHQFFDTIGLLGPEGKAPNWLVPHFESSIRNLSAYRPAAMDPSKGPIPKTYTIMAQDGVCKFDTDPRPEMRPEDPPHMRWLLFNRTDFGPIGWEALLGQENIVSLESIANANHFTMMREPGVNELPARIREALK